MPRGLGPVQRKILLLLLGGAGLSLSQSPRQYFRVVKEVSRGWRAINRRSLHEAIGKLYQSKLLGTKENADGTVTLILNESGRRRALTFALEELTIPKPKRWDKKWHIVIFDIPEYRRRVRDAIRACLLHAGFLELQKSVFVCPFPCGSEVEYITEFFGARRYIRYIVAESIDNQLHLKKRFGLL